jgi:glutamine cyclotransferase
MKRSRFLQILAGLLLMGHTYPYLSCATGKKTAPKIEKNDPGPSAITYSIINTYPHDTSSFTQGLIIYNGSMYEGTGELMGRSN